MFILIVIVCCFVLYLWLKRKVKFLKLSSLNLINGGVKTGKSTLAVYLCIKKWRERKNKIVFKNFVLKCINKIIKIVNKIFKKDFSLKKLYDIPCLYSNIPILLYKKNSKKFKKYQKYCCVLSKNIALRKVRAVENSIFYIGEFSLFADSFNIKDMLINEQLKKFFKLIGHECNGLIITDSQSLLDCHFSLKRNLTRYIYIYSMHNIPFLPLLKVNVIEKTYCSNDDGSISELQINNGDVENNVKSLIIFKNVWKLFDYRCYSALTDDLEIEAIPIQLNKYDNGNLDLRAKNIVSFNKNNDLSN